MSITFENVLNKNKLETIKINDAVKDVVDNITLADLVQWQLEENQTNDYCI